MSAGMTEGSAASTSLPSRRIPPPSPPRSLSLANKAQVRKRVRQSARLYLLRHAQRTRARTVVKNVLLAVRGGDKTVAEERLKLASSLLDKMARKGVIHSNKAARSKSRLSHRVRSLA